MKVKGAIFDLDGTLLDSMWLWQNICDDYLAENGFSAQGMLSEEFRTMSLDKSSEYIRVAFNLDKTAEQIYDEIMGMAACHYEQSLKLKDGAEELLKKLAEKGVKMCIASAGMRSLVEAAVKRTGIDKYISEIFTCSEVGAPKTEPDVFLKAIQYLGSSPEETLVFEDSLLAIATAKKIGCKTVGVYDASAEDTAEQIIALSDVYLKSFDEWRIDL